jgi:hypothetical protein
MQFKMNPDAEVFQPVTLQPVQLVFFHNCQQAEIKPVIDMTKYEFDIKCAIFKLNNSYLFE